MAMHIFPLTLIIFFPIARTSFFIGFDYTNNTMGVLLETEAAYSSRAPWFTIDCFSGVRVVHIFSCPCVFCLFC
jgi:hypothetical protein